jgi:hypothetical protein
MRARLHRAHRDTEPRHAPPRRRSREAAPVREPANPAVTGGIEDRELYSCSCGIVFQGLVSASAKCPRCGAEQAW